MPTISISYNEQVTHTKDVELPAYVYNGGDYYRIIAEDAFIQVSRDNGLTIKKWENNSGSVRRLLTDTNYTSCTAETFNTQYSAAISEIASLIA